MHNSLTFNSSFDFTTTCTKQFPIKHFSNPPKHKYQIN